MRAKCPNCKTSYDLKPLANPKASATIICAVCSTHLDVAPPSWRSLFVPKVTVRQHPDKEE